MVQPPIYIIFNILVQFQEVANAVTRSVGTVGSLFSLVIDYCSKRCTGETNTTLFNSILNALSNDTTRE